MGKNKRKKAVAVAAFAAPALLMVAQPSPANAASRTARCSGTDLVRPALLGAQSTCFTPTLPCAAGAICQITGRITGESLVHVGPIGVHLTVTDPNGITSSANGCTTAANSCSAQVAPIVAEGPVDFYGQCVGITGSVEVLATVRCSITVTELSGPAE